MPEANILSAKDVELLKRLLRDVEKLKGGSVPRKNPLRSSRQIENDYFPNEVFVALTPAGGIPALTPVSSSETGTGGGPSPPIGPPPLGTPIVMGASGASGDKPGSAVCEIYRIDYDGAGTAHTLVPMGYERVVWNYSETAISAACWVLIVRDKHGAFWAVPPQSSLASTGIMAVVPIAVIEGWDPPSCFSDPGTGTVHGPNCPPRLHVCQLQQWDATCAKWEVVRCVYGADVGGQTLQLYKRYFAWVVDFPEGPGAIVLPPGIDCDTVSSTELWMTDAGDPTRTFIIVEEVGIICDEDTTGSAAELDDDEVVCYEGRTRVYLAQERQWDDESCSYTLSGFESYLVDTCGKRLPSGYPLEGSYADTIPRVRFEPEDTSGECLPLYEVACGGYTGYDQHIISDDCVEHEPTSGTEECDPGVGDRLLRIAQEFKVCGKTVTRKVVEYRFQCCCTFACSPGNSQIDCAPCDEVPVAQRPSCITITVDTNGECPCADGSYTACLNGNCYRVVFDVCDTQWEAFICCLGDGTWWAGISCGTCAYPNDPNDPPPEIGCASLGVPNVASCSPFSGSITLGPIECQQGTCAGVTSVNLTFSA